MDTFRADLGAGGTALAKKKKEKKRVAAYSVAKVRETVRQC